ncbi:hypothetical protein HK104_003049 [Borealophlyctis nickersoniae]|nr:hypothetical protein HK104_003049 [Borealophlyctis nickersoniae]
MPTTTLTPFSYLTLLIFSFVIAFCIRPIRIPFPIHIRQKKYHLHLNLATAPVIGILLLLITTAIDGNVVKNGFVGTQGIQPYSVLILVFALAYICISIDLTSLFEVIAFKVAKFGGSSGTRLFFYLMLLSTVMTIFTSNDVVVLTITPIICYLAEENKIDPKSFLISNFMVSNIASMALYIGNPTNVIVAQAFGISFITYSAWMILPTLVGCVVCYAACYILLRRRIPQNIPPPPSSAEKQYRINDRFGAVFGVGVLLTCLLALLVVPVFAEVGVWILTLPFAGVMVVKDVLRDLLNARRGQNGSPGRDGGDMVEEMCVLPSTRGGMVVHGPGGALPLDATTVDIGESPCEGAGDLHGESRQTNGSPNEDAAATHKSLATSASSSSDVALVDSSKEQLVSPPALSRRHSSFQLIEQPPTPLSRSLKSTSQHHTFPRTLRRTLPTLTKIGARLPWSLIPFSLGMFILVESLDHVGWTALLSTALAHLCPTLAVATFVTCIITTLACNLLNNLPMSILFARVFQHPNFATTLLGMGVLPDRVDAIKRGGLFALIIGSNIGANVLFVGSLAGLMWSDLLEKRGMRFKQSVFFKWCVLVTPVVLVGTCGALTAELVVMGYNK